MKDRNIYLDKVPLSEARKIILDNFRAKYSKKKTEVIPVEEALNRVNAEAVFAKSSAPHYYASAMDGVAVDVEVTFGVSDRNPKELTIGEEVFFIDTGEPIPEGCNGVIMIEDVNQIDKDTLEITQAATPWQHIRAIGEDINAAELVLSANTKIGPAEIGSLLASGVTEIKVNKEPVVAILPTGTELVEPGVQLEAGNVVEYNSRVISSQVQEWGGQPSRLDKIKDDYELIKKKVENLSKEHDIVLIIAGSSAGSEDYTSQVIEDLGELLFHGVAIKPGKPLMAGLVNGKLVIGVPGYPVSAYLNTQLFVKPLIETFLGLSISKPLEVEAGLVQKLISKLGQEEFIRVKLVEIDGTLKAIPLKRGAGAINSVAKADGFIRVPALSQGLQVEDKINVELHKGINYRQNLLAVGEQDYVFELLKDQLALDAELNLHLKDVDSRTGLEFLRQKQANMALLKTNNLETLKETISSMEELEQQLVVVNLVRSQIGLAVASGNPKAINELQDLVKEDVLFVNRQQRAASREVLDNKLQNLKINDKIIRGYEHEESTDLGVANLIKEGIVDVGLVSQGVAELFGLEFISLGQVNLNLVLSETEFATDRMQSLWEIVKSYKFKTRLKNILGYDTKETGEIIYRK
ncbi:molybdopterin molybdochelatase [Candidatus Frackibacter sp. WG11]|uniref:molybdopterin biosynthesis protein n=1 Tax=Candidatus Frackibacter sp. WG11 TaxID=2017976 RepID=UPI0008849973|nr:molybdopterin biosynthesis protein [Candidatus Frackibacter sp. WG11]SDC23983.1 molybdopterin molybdochelatase [Candidatus Frackibacter sp. WG11]